MYKRYITVSTKMFLLIVILIGCSKGNERFNEEFEKGERAMSNHQYEVAIESFSNALALKPNDPDATISLRSAEKKAETVKAELNLLMLKQSLAKYVISINELQGEFVQAINSKDTQNALNLLVIKASFNPPQQIHEIHKIYISFIKEWLRSQDLADLGKFVEATEAVKNTDVIFSEFNNMFIYFLDDNEISFIDVGYSGRFGY